MPVGAPEQSQQPVKMYKAKPSMGVEGNSTASRTSWPFITIGVGVGGGVDVGVGGPGVAVTNWGCVPSGVGVGLESPPPQAVARKAVRTQAVMANLIGPAPLKLEICVQYAILYIERGSRKGKKSPGQEILRKG